MAKILVVDDQKGIRMLLRRFLETQGHEVHEAADAVTALTTFREQQPHLVFADVVMPGRSGTELLVDLKALSPGTPVVIMSGQASVQAAVECLKSGASDFLLKPLDFGKITEVVQTCLTAPPGDTGTLVLATNDRHREIAGYRIRRTLGYGNFGVVYLADKEFEGRRREVALKVLREGLSDEARARFTREAEMTSLVHHPNVVRILDFNVAANATVPYIAMEFVAGTTLRRELQRNPGWNYEEKTRLLRQLFLALGAIHAHHLCHRDVKPENLMITAQSELKLTDFGIVRPIDSSLTAATSLLGTPAYMAPEAFSTSAVEGRADLFSAGVVAYELFLERVPFAAESLPGLAVVISTQRPLEPRRLDHQFPVALQQVLARLLKKGPDERYASAAEVIVDLDRYLATPGPESFPPGPLPLRLTRDDWGHPVLPARPAR